MRITSKGQVTIPRHIRDAAGMLPETEVEFQIIKGQVIIRKVKGRSKKPTRGRKLVDQLTGKGDVALTTEEIMALTRGDDSDAPEDVVL